MATAQIGRNRYYKLSKWSKPRTSNRHAIPKFFAVNDRSQDCRLQTNKILI